MNKKIPILPVILCGGSGSRLWPLSRKSFPKQYLSIDINDDFSFLQNTLNRIKKLKYLENPIIICNQEHRFITAEQIRKIEIKPKSIILEPLSRNTAPAIAIAALESMKNGDDPILLILPSDHQIKDNEEFLKTITRVNDLNLDKKILTFGVNPHSPSTAYGYIKSKKSKSEKEIFPLKIEKFLEKPDKTLAENIYQDDLYSWNSGIFISRASTIVNELEKYSPDIIFNCREALRKKINDLDFTRLEENSFKKCPNISFDKALMEKTDLGFVLPLNAKWSDIGGWKSFWEQSKKDPNGNVLIGDSIQLSSKNNLISSYSRLTIGFGINDLIIVETDDALLVTKKEHSDDIKLLVDELKLRNRELQKHLFDFIGAGTIAPKFLIDKKFEENNKTLNIEYFDMENIYKSKEEYTQIDIEKFIEENKDQLKREYIDFKYVILNPKNLIGIDEFNQDFFNEIDKIENQISQGDTFNSLVQNINVDIIEINEFAPGNDEQQYENLIYSKKSSKLDLIESGDNFLLYNIDKEYDKDPDLSDEKINSKIRELVYQTGKFDFNRGIIEEIQSKKFDNTRFNELGSSNKEFGSINSINDDKLFETQSVKMLYALPINSFSLVNDNANKIYMVKITGSNKNSFNKQDEDYKNFVNSEFTNTRKSILTAYDELLTKKYQVQLNQKTIDRVKNYFK